MWQPYIRWCSENRDDPSSTCLVLRFLRPSVVPSQDSRLAVMECMVELKGFLSWFCITLLHHTDMLHATTSPSYLMYMSDGPMPGVVLDLYNTRVCMSLHVFFMP